ncbi:hypothetical protein ORI89_04100 [Sphingobacterium sp. UT-1RO-CII-1]|nr:hypothetical protein [Sphingobacterium sp. UT-1RO-CII-1]
MGRYFVENRNSVDETLQTGDETPNLQVEICKVLFYCDLYGLLGASGIVCRFFNVYLVVELNNETVSLKHDDKE